MSADNDKGQCLCVANPEEWKTNLATVRPTFARPPYKRHRKKLAVFKGKETSHEPFLNRQTNAPHLHIMNGPYYSKSKCCLWDKAGCWMLIRDQEAADEGISTFLPQSNRHRPQTVQNRWLFASPGTGPTLPRDLILLQATKLVTLCVLEKLEERCRAKPGQAHHKVQVRCSAVQHSRTGWAPEQLMKQSGSWITCLVSGKSSGMPKGNGA